MDKNIIIHQKNTSKQINIYGYESHQSEFLKKWIEKINNIQDKIFSVMLDIELETNLDNFEKNSTQIIKIQETTKKEILAINQDKYPTEKNRIIKRRKLISYDINTEIVKKIEILNDLREYITLNKDLDIEYKVQQFKKQYTELNKLIKILDGAYFQYQKELSLIEGRLSLIRETNR